MEGLFLQVLDFLLKHPVPLWVSSSIVILMSYFLLDKLGLVKYIRFQFTKSEKESLYYQKELEKIHTSYDHIQKNLEIVIAGTDSLSSIIQALDVQVKSIDDKAKDDAVLKEINNINTKLQALDTNLSNLKGMLIGISISNSKNHVDILK